MSRASAVIITVMAIIIVILAWLLWTVPASAPATATEAASSTEPVQVATSSASAATSTTATLIVNSPKSGATVSPTFTVTGSAPSGWFFEAVFPIQVRDPDDNLIATAQGKAQGDWTVPGAVAFTAHVSLTTAYHGPATLILLKDNPSGNPETSDEVTMPITIQ